MTITIARLAGKTKPQHRGNGLGHGTNPYEGDQFMFERTDTRSQTATCERQECDRYNEPEHYEHRIEFNREVSIVAREDGPWTLHLRTFIYEGNSMVAVADGVAKAVALASDLNSEPQDRTQFVAGNVRALVGMTHGNAFATHLQRILDVSVQRARDLLAGRRPFTLDELEALSAFFEVETVADWFAMERPGKARGRASDKDWLDQAYDRLVTYREEQHA